MENKRRLVGAAAGCAVAIATLLGAPAASAQPPPECITCEPDHTPPAFMKTEAPGAPARAFNKSNAPADVFLKIPGGTNYPGNTENVFKKD